MAGPPCPPGGRPHPVARAPGGFLASVGRGTDFCTSRAERAGGVGKLGCRSGGWAPVASAGCRALGGPWRAPLRSPESLGTRDPAQSSPFRLWWAVHPPSNGGSENMSYSCSPFRTYGQPALCVGTGGGGHHSLSVARGLASAGSWLGRW